MQSSNAAMHQYSNMPNEWLQLCSLVVKIIKQIAAVMHRSSADSSSAARPKWSKSQTAGLL